MKGDFSRISFDPANHFSSVLLQQGRVTLDADPNEQAAILLHYVRTLARDLIGPYGGPQDHLGFELGVDSGTNATLSIGAGRYYVEGILCESEGCDYAQQPDYSPTPIGNAGAGDALLVQLKNPQAGMFWLYLDVWERLITSIEDDRIRESALGGPDTCVRTKVVWQVKSFSVVQLLDMFKVQLDRIASELAKSPDDVELIQQQNRLSADRQLLEQASDNASGSCRAPLSLLQEKSTGRMAARLDEGSKPKDPCVLPVEAMYRGTENHLYRVEIHRASTPSLPATFKWSRDNGSMAAHWLGTEGSDLILSSTRGFEAGDWVELSHDELDLAGVPGVLLRLVKVENGRLSFDPQSVPSGASAAWSAQLRNPKVRRWNQRESEDVTLDAGAVPIAASAGQAVWIDLEDGVQVQFEADGSYRSGDYWLIPARVATGGIDWPVSRDGTSLQPARGVLHRYAPLGFIEWSSDAVAEITDCRCKLLPITDCQAALAERAERASVAGAEREDGAAIDRKKTRRSSTTKP